MLAIIWGVVELASILLTTCFAYQLKIFSPQRRSGSKVFSVLFALYSLSRINFLSNSFKEPMQQFTWAQARHLARFSIARLREGRLPQVAGSLTFTTVLALVPVITIALAIFTAFPLFSSFRSSVESYFLTSLMPKGISNTILGYLTQFATKATRLSAVGGVALMLTAFMTVATIDHAFNQIWRVKRVRPWMQRVLVYWAIITLGPLLIGISISLTTYAIAATGDVVGSVPMLRSTFSIFVSLVFTTLAFTLLYVAIPNRTVSWRDAAVGGLFAGIIFEIAKRLFTIFIVKFPTYKAVYGALAAVPIFLLWIYLSWYITLIGAVVSASLPVFKFERWWHVPTPGSQFLDAMRLMKVLYLARSERQDAAVDIATMRVQTRFGIDEIDGLLEKMLELGWVGKLAPEMPRIHQSSRRIRQKISESVRGRKLNNERWVLLANPSLLTLADVYRVFVFDTQTGVKDELASYVVNQVELGLQDDLQSYFDRAS
jgi:membrane protein